MLKSGADCIIVCVVCVSLLSMSTTPILFHRITISITSILQTSVKRVTIIVSITVRTAIKRIIHEKLRKLYVIDDNVDKGTFHTYIMEQCDADVQIA